MSYRMGTMAGATGGGCLQSLAMGLGLPISVATLWGSLVGKIGSCTCFSDLGASQPGLFWALVPRGGLQ